MLEYSQPRSLRACSRDDPECGARRGVLRRRLVTVRPGRPGKPPARHYDLAARSSLHGSGGNAGDGSAAPGEKTATVERREASVPRYGTQGASQAPGVPRHKRVHARLVTRRGHAQRVLSAAPERFSALRPPLDSGWRSKGANPGRKNAPREREWLFDIVRYLLRANPPTCGCT